MSRLKTFQCMPVLNDQLSLAFGFTFEDLYQSDALARLDARFLKELAATDAALAERLLAARANPDSLERKPQSELILELAPHLEDFIGELFGIGPEQRALQERHSALAPLYALKRKFIQKKAISGVSKEQASAIDGPAAGAELESLFGEPLTEASFVRHVGAWIEDEKAHAAELGVAARYGAWAALSDAGRHKHRGGVLFKVPHKLDMQNLVQLEAVNVSGVPAVAMPEHEWRLREGFKLTDQGMDLTAALDQAQYCIKCHNQGKDSCSTGLKEKDGSFKSSVFGVTLAGCPLDEKISEMNLAKQEGHTVGALAIAVIDNPMAAATGHRICNDCMKACVFQKQDPVDIPQVETRTLKDVLELP